MKYFMFRGLAALCLSGAIAVASASPAQADPISLLVTAVAGALQLGAIGTAALQIGAAIGLSLLSKSLMKKKSGSTVQGGRTLSLSIDTNVPRQVIFGRAATAGSLAYWQCTGTDNKTLQLVIALADHECQGLVEVWVDGKKKSWNSTTKQVSGYSGKLRIYFYNGTATQGADAHVRDASDGRWTNNCRGLHVCYAVVEADDDETLFPAGVPQIVFVIDGAKLYDPRLDTTVGGSGSQRWGSPSTYTYSRNASVISYNVLRGFYAGGQLLLGLEAPADTVRLSDFESSANACDESVALGAGGSEPRYRAGFVVSIDAGGQPNRDALETAREAMAGDIVCSGGIYRILAGVARASVVSLTDADLIPSIPLTAEPRRPRSELSNAVTGSFVDPTRSWQSVPLPARTSSVDEEADGGVRLAQPMDLAGVSSRTQAQRLMEIARKRARRQGVVSATFRAKHFRLEPGDWVTFSSDRRGYDGQDFEIEQARVNPDLTIDLVMREVDAEIDDWSTGDELDDNESADLATGGPTLTEVTGLEVATATISGTSGASRPGLRATWTPIADSTVVEVLLEYRKLGDTVALEKRALRPSAGQLTWLDGIQGGITYQVRALPITRPERGVTWSAWAQTGTNTSSVAVDIAAYAENVNPENLPPAVLDEQSRLDLIREFMQMAVFEGIDGQLDDIADVISDLNDAIIQYGQQINDPETGLATRPSAFAFNQLTTRVGDVEDVNGKKNSIFRQDTAPTALAIGDLWYNTSQGNKAYRASTVGTTGWVPTDNERIDDAWNKADAAVSNINQLVSKLGGNLASVFDYGEAINGLAATKTLGVNANGNVAIIDLEGNEYGSTITFIGNTFYFSHPSVAGGAPVPLLAIKTIDGAAKFAFNGELVVNAILSGSARFTSLKAISSNFDDMTCTGIQRSANNKMIIDWSRVTFQMDFA